MRGGAAKGPSELWVGNEFGAVPNQRREQNSGMNWTELLKPENGGPGESPGRERAIEEAREITRERYAAGKFKKAKGSSKAKPSVQVSREEVRKKGW